MKKITDMLISDLKIDPSILLESDLSDMIHKIRIDIISNIENEQLIFNIYIILKKYFSQIVIDEIVKSTLPDDRIKKIDRDWKVSQLLDYGK